MAAADDPLHGLERWYLAQCNGDWEHSHLWGVLKAFLDWAEYADENG
jgi:hypothetical protein